MVQSCGPNEAAALLARVEGHGRGRALAVGLGAAPRGAVRIAGARARDELRPVALAHVLAARLTGARSRIRASVSTGIGTGTGTSISSITRISLVTRASAGSGTVITEATTLLAGLELGADAGADAGASEGGAAGASAVGGTEAGAADELAAGAVANVLLARRVRGQGAWEGYDGESDCGRGKGLVDIARMEDGYKVCAFVWFAMG